MFLLVTMFFFFGAVYSAVIPSVGSSVVAFSSVVPTFAPRSDALCAPRGNHTAPKPSSNSLSGFAEDTQYDQLASSAPIPAGYALAMNNANCAFSSTRYMLYVQLDSYSPETCAELCNTHEGCDSFNIYIQRDPSVIPGPACPNPYPIAVTKCALYSEPEKISSCTNFGQHIGPVDADGEAFKIAIRGSNAYNKVSVKQVCATVTTTVTETVQHHDRRASTIFIEPTSTEYDGTTTVRIPKATPVYVDPETIDAPASVVTVTSSIDYYVDTTTITISEPSFIPANPVTITSKVPATTITVHITHPADTITLTSKGADTTTTVLIPQQTDSSAVASTVTVPAPGTTTTVTLPTPMETITSTVYGKRDIAAAQFEGKEEGAERWDSWTKEWLPANMGTVRPPIGPSSTVTVTIFGPAFAADVTQAFDNFPGHSALPATPVATPATRTRSVPTAAATDLLSTVGNGDAPMKTVTLDDSYTYTGPTDVPMKTITLRG